MTPRWHQEGPRIVWDVANDTRLPHEDHVEMSGRNVSLIVRYGIARNGILNRLERRHIWPRYRHRSTDVRGYLTQTIGGIRRRGEPYEHPPFDPWVWIDGDPVELRKVDRATFFGALAFEGECNGLKTTRTLFPSETRGGIETISIRNLGSAARRLEYRLPEFRRTEFVFTDSPSAQEVEILSKWSASVANGDSLAPGEVVTFTCHTDAAQTHGARSHADHAPIDAEVEWSARADRHIYSDRLRLETPDPVLDQFFDFSRIRASESLFDTKMGLVHSPGGGRYYGGVWANDQAEYAAPFFGLLGDPLAIEATLNAYRIFASHTNPEYRRVPCSIEVEGDVLFWGRDRGDAAMIAWGASTFAMCLGDRNVAEELWGLIDWCLEYCRRRRAPSGLIESETDELEGRFSTGTTNLCTSCLAYGGFRAAANLARALGKSAPDSLDAEADALQKAIDVEFGADIQGFATYRYHEGLETLRAWICLPLAMGIFDRVPGTLAALFSDRLWTDDGLATAQVSSQPGETVFWDRSTLYALQGVFYAGRPDLALEKLTQYANRRLLGDHVPYPVEAFPEGGQAHLSAESALLCRVFTDGLFGIRPRSLRAFELRPHLPSGWPKAAIRKITGFGHRFDIEVERVESDQTKWQATICALGRAPIQVEGEWGQGQTVDFDS